MKHKRKIYLQTKLKHMQRDIHRIIKERKILLEDLKYAKQNESHYKNELSKLMLIEYAKLGISAQ